MSKTFEDYLDYRFAISKPAYTEDLRDFWEKAQEAMGETQVAWRYHIARYCDHAACDGVVLDKSSLANIPKAFITWTPVTLAELKRGTDHAP